MPECLVFAQGRNGLRAKKFAIRKVSPQIDQQLVFGGISFRLVTRDGGTQNSFEFISLKNEPREFVANEFREAVFVGARQLAPNKPGLAFHRKDRFGETLRAPLSLREERVNQREPPINDGGLRFLGSFQPRLHGRFPGLRANGIDTRLFMVVAEDHGRKNAGRDEQQDQTKAEGFQPLAGFHLFLRVKKSQPFDDAFGSPTWGQLHLGLPTNGGPEKPAIRLV